MTMDGQPEIVALLKQIRDEAKQTNVRVEELSQRLDRYVGQLDEMAHRQTESELRLATEVLSLADVTRQVRDLLSTKLDDHGMVLDHEERIRSIEHRIADHE